MFTKLKKFASSIVSKTFQKDQYKKTLNLPILFIIILIDLFLIFSIFTGLSNVAIILGDSNKFYPCTNEIETIRSLDREKELKGEEHKIDYISNLNYEIGTTGIIYGEKELKGEGYKIDYIDNLNYSNNYYGNRYDQPEVDSYCKEFGKVRNNLLRSQIIKSTVIDINNLKLNIFNKESQIKNLQNQYDSTLLEKIAGQEAKNSINSANSETTKNSIELINKENKELSEVIKKSRKIIIDNQEVKNYLAYPINKGDQYYNYRKRLSDFEFWLPVKSFILQLFYLAPVILISFFLSKYFASKQWQILGVISWNIFLLSFIPLILKIMNFLQFGTIYDLIYRFFAYLFSSFSDSFLFLLSYLYIIAIPCVGYLFIWILQKTIFNKTLTYRKRIANSRCINCNTNIKESDIFCNYCGTSQYETCPNCHQSSRVGAEFCQHCGIKK